MSLRDLLNDILAAAILHLIWVGGIVACALVVVAVASGAEPPRYTVESKLPKYTVANKVPAAPAPPVVTYRYYQDAAGQWWKVEATAPEVRSGVRPFSGSTTDTTAPVGGGTAASGFGAAPSLPSSAATSGTVTRTVHAPSAVRYGPTRTLRPPALYGGGTNCATGFG